jgi:peptidoglycan/xylan/chitin deacetylase (PgdA/CDA1 family)
MYADNSVSGWEGGTLSINLRQRGRNCFKVRSGANRRVHYRAGILSRQRRKNYDMPEKYIRQFSLRIVARVGRAGLQDKSRDGSGNDRAKARDVYYGNAGIPDGVVHCMKRVTLTFDNGPTPGITEQVLDILSIRRIQTTFFIVGEKLGRPGARALAVRAHAEGHWIGNHSFTHSAPLGEKPDEEYARREIVETQGAIGELAHADNFFRPVGGGGVIGPHLLSRPALQLLQDGKFTCVLWSSVPGDWKDQPGWVERCVADVIAREWTVVVIHDVENAALPRLPELLDRLQSLGVEFRQDFPGDVVVMRRGEVASSDISQIVTG